MTGYVALAALAAVAALSLTAVGFLLFRRPPAPREATWQDVEAEAQRGGYRLISTEELAARIRREPGSLRLVDTREPWEYKAGHLRGAVSFPLAPTRLARWRSGRALAALLGPDRRRAVVFY